MSHKQIDIGIAHQLARYSDAVEAQSNLRWLFTSGALGLTAAGETPPDITAQAEIVWGHLLHMLATAGMRVSDIVKVTQYLTRRGDLVPYAKVRGRFLGDHQAASTVLIVAELARPEFLVEVEIVAARS